MCDGTQPLTEEDHDLLREALAQADTILLANKRDLPDFALPQPAANDAPNTLTVVPLSAKTGDGLDTLETTLAQRAETLLPQAAQSAAGDCSPTSARPRRAQLGLGRRDPRQRRPRPGHDPRCPSHRRGSRPGSPGRADRPHRPGGYHRPHLLPLLRGEMRGNTKVVQFSVIFQKNP